MPELQRIQLKFDLLQLMTLSTLWILPPTMELHFKSSIYSFIFIQDLGSCFSDDPGRELGRFDATSFSSFFFVATIFKNCFDKVETEYCGCRSGVEASLSRHVTEPEWTKDSNVSLSAISNRNHENLHHLKKFKAFHLFLRFLGF